MYFIIQGECVINIMDHEEKTHQAIKLLVEGSHFGEIGLIYKRKRTADVISRNYITMAGLSYPNYREIINEFPVFLHYLKLYLYEYKDVNQVHIINVIKDLYFFKDGFSNTIGHDFMYSLKERYVEPG